MKLQLNQDVIDKLKSEILKFKDVEFVYGYGRIGPVEDNHFPDLDYEFQEMHGLVAITQFHIYIKDTHAGNWSFERLTDIFATYNSSVLDYEIDQAPPKVLPSLQTFDGRIIRLRFISDLPFNTIGALESCSFTCQRLTVDLQLEHLREERMKTFYSSVRSNQKSLDALFE